MATRRTCSSCEELAKNCPQNACGDAAFADVACPAFTNQYGFKIGSQIKCMASTDTWCFSNGTSMVLACKSETGSGAAGVSTSLPVRGGRGRGLGGAVNAGRGMAVAWLPSAAASSNSKGNRRWGRLSSRSQHVLWVTGAGQKPNAFV
jgi:hypothetical protein